MRGEQHLVGHVSRLQYPGVAPGNSHSYRPRDVSDALGGDVYGVRLGQLGNDARESDGCIRFCLRRRTLQYRVASLDESSPGYLLNWILRGLLYRVFHTGSDRRWLGPRTGRLPLPLIIRFVDLLNSVVRLRRNLEEIDWLESPVSRKRLEAFQGQIEV